MAQLTDTHVFDERDCPARMKLFFDAFRQQAANADLTFHTGDVIMDALVVDRAGTEKQWALWHELAKQLPHPPRYSIGNHDVWGVAPAGDPLEAKKWAVDTLKLEGRSYAFSQGGWRFIVLDSTHRTPEGGWYTGRLDEEQLSWLTAELAGTDTATPIAIVSHIPLLSAAVVRWSKVETGRWSVGAGLMHGDSHNIQALFAKHPNVKVCLSGHLHLNDSVVYDGVNYLGCGAVSGNWWNSDAFHRTRCGFATFDFMSDGTVVRTYHEYEWARS